MNNPRFVRELNLWDASAIVVGCIIGAGIFRVPHAIAQHLENPLAILLTWVAGGVLSMAGALCFAELAGLFPKTGGDYVYLRETYGPLVSFLFGWTKLFVERTGTIAIIAFVFAEYLSYLLGFPQDCTRAAAVAAIIALTAANIAGLKYGKSIQNIFTAIKVLALASIILLGFFFLPREIQQGRTFPLANGDGFSFSTLQSMGMALIFVLWTYGGWTEAAYVAEEVKEPARNVPLAIIGGLSGVILLYLLINMVYYLYLSADEIRASKLVASVVVEKMIGHWGGKWVAFFVVASTFGALNGYILTGGRILYALGEDHALFRKLSTVHERFHTPFVALIFNGACSVILVLTKTFDQLMEYTTIIISIFFALTGLSVILLRIKRPDANRSYRVWGYPLTPIIFVGSTFLFIGNAIVKDPGEAVFGLLLASAGLILYWISGRMDRHGVKL